MLGLQSALAQVPDAELSARQQHLASPISIESVLINETGERLTGVLVKAVSATEPAVEFGSATTDPDGYFVVENLPRENLILEIRADGYRAEFIYAQLARPSGQAVVTLDPIILVFDAPDEVRMIFGGDTAWARRFYDSDLDGRVKLFDVPVSDPEAFIDTADPLPGTESTVQFVKLPFVAADFSSINLETPVLSSPPFTPHIEKDFAFYTLRDSIHALPSLGIDYVGLGNNHLWDYLTDGVVETISALNNDLPDIGFSGAGLNESEALAPYRFERKGQDYSMLAATSITGASNGFSDPFFVYVANDEYRNAMGEEVGKGGAANLTDRSSFRDSIQAERTQGRIPIVQLHTGDEYTFEPTSTARLRMTRSVDDGAELVIAHHPHVAQGLELYQGKLLVHSLGNFIFDQERLETMLGLTAQLDYRGETLVRGRVGGIYLEDFRPRPVTGNWAGTFLRRINQFSRSALVFPYNGSGWVQPDASGTVQRDYQLELAVELDAAGTAIVDLRHLITSEGLVVPAEAALSQLNADVPAQFQLGRDILERQGEFEDYDVDDDAGALPSFESPNNTAARWFWDSSVNAKYLCLDRPFRGASAACSTRSSTNSSDTVIAFRNRIRLMRAEACGPVNPNRDLTLFGYARGDNAGEMRAEVRYFPSREEQVSFAPADGSVNETMMLGSGTFPWRAVYKDLSIPIEDPADYPEPAPDSGNCSLILKEHIRTQTARALRIFLDHSPPEDGEGIAAFDEFAVINWQPALAGGSTDSVSVPSSHSLDFLKVSGAANQTIMLNMTMSRLVPSVAAGIIVEPFDDGLFEDSFESF